MAIENKCGLHIRLDEAAVAAESKREEVKGFLADLRVEGTDREALYQELLIIEGMIALADHLQNPGRPLSELVDVPTLARMKAERNPNWSEIKVDLTIDRVKYLGATGGGEQII